MKNIILIVALFLSFSFGSPAKAGEKLYEYASFSSMGTKSSIVWPDGSVLKLGDRFKRPDDANERMFYMTMALNVFAQNGYELYGSDTTPMFMNVGHENDLVFRRQIVKSVDR
jgi:hypothetical protein